MLRSCHRCRGDLTRTVLHPDTPAISVEAVLAIIDSELSGWEQSVTVPTRIATYAIDALREIRDRIEAPT